MRHRQPLCTRRRGRNRRRQDLCVPGAGPAVGRTHVAQHGDEDAPGPALHARHPEAARRARRACHGGPAQGAIELPVPASPRPGARPGPPAGCVRGARAGPHRSVGADHRGRRPGGDHRPRRTQQRHPAGHVHARELSRQRVPRLPCLPRQQGASRRDGGRCRRRQPPPVLRRHGAARRRRRRAAAERRAGRVRRSAPAGRGRRAVPRHRARHLPAHRFRTRHAGCRPAAGTRARALAGSRRGLRQERARPAHRRDRLGRSAQQPQAALGRTLRLCRVRRRAARGRPGLRGGPCRARHGERARS